MNIHPYAISQSQMISTFVPEQIVKGRISEIFPDRTALVNTGQGQFVARIGKVDPPLQTGKEYLLQIQSTNEPPLAKIISETDPKTNAAGRPSVNDILSALNLRSDPVTRQLVQQFLDYGNPLTRSSIRAARALVSGHTLNDNDAQTIQWLNRRHLPLTADFFLTARSLADPKQLGDHLRNIKNKLQHSDFHSPETAALEKALIQFSESTSSTPNGTSRSQSLIFTILKQLGFGYERTLRQQLLHGESLDGNGTIKERLLAVLQDQRTPQPIREPIRHAVRQITGEQLQMLTADPALAQFSLQLPIPLNNGAFKNVSIYWEGKRDQKGRIDPQSFRILLYLSLSHLKETMISIRVQKKDVTVIVQNESVDLSKWLRKEENALRSRLGSLHFHLVSLTQAKRIDPQLLQKVQPLSDHNYNLDVKV